MINDLKRLREKKKVSHSTLEKKLGITQSEIYDIENNLPNNILINNKKLIRKIIKYFDVEEYELIINTAKKQAITNLHTEVSDVITRVIFLDTSICMDNYHFQRNFLKYFDRICIPKTVIEELNFNKDSRNMLKSDKARRALRNIQDYTKSIEREFGQEIGKENDDKIFNAVENYAEKNKNISVFFLSADRYHNIKKTNLTNIVNITPDEFYNEIEKFDQTFSIEDTKVFWKYIENNSASSIERMDLSKVDINGVYKNGYTPLCYAIMNRRTEIVSLLLRLENIDINVTGSNPHGYGALHCAVAVKNINLVNRILNKNSTYLHVMTKDDSINNVTALMVAVTKNLEELTKLLLEFGSSVNQQDSNGMTALHRAAINKNLAIYELLKPYADESILDSNYNTAEEYLQ